MDDVYPFVIFDLAARCINVGRLYELPDIGEGQVVRFQQVGVGLDDNFPFPSA